MPFFDSQVIVVGGGLAGLCAAHTALEKGSRVVLLDKKPSLGGNSVKASSGINGANTEAQKNHGIQDTVKDFYDDTVASAGDLLRPHLAHALTENSAPSLAWLTSQFGVDLSLVARLGGHNIPRTHRGQGGAPGWAMISALVKKLEEYEKAEEPRAKIFKGTRVIKLLEESGKVTGVEVETPSGERVKGYGNVIIATGGFAADFTDGGYLQQYRSDLLSLPTTNGDHATGDGHKLVTALSHPATLTDMDQVQVHPTGFIDPKDPEAKTKFLAAEALRGVGGLLIDNTGARFINELERRDTVTAKMQEVIGAGRGPIRLVLNSAAADVLKAHCGFYVSKGLMKKYDSAQELSKETDIPLDTLRTTFEAHVKATKGEEEDLFGKKNFDNGIYTLDEPLLVASMIPVVHYTMGGITVDEHAHALDADGKLIPGLYAAGEVIGGVHGKNRLGGSSLLEAVVFGRIAGANAVTSI